MTPTPNPMPNPTPVPVPAPNPPMPVGPQPVAADVPAAPQDFDVSMNARGGYPTKRITAATAEAAARLYAAIFKLAPNAWRLAVAKPAAAKKPA